MVINPSITPIGFGQWRFNWSSDQAAPAVPVYRIYRDGNLIATTTLTSWTVLTDGNELPIFQILDDLEGDPVRTYPSRVTVAWFADPQVASYDVQEYVSAIWTSRQIIRADGATPYYRWNSRVLEDVTTHQFRVIPTGSNGNAGTAASLVVPMVRVPDPPSEARFSYSAATGKLTISE